MEGLGINALVPLFSFISNGKKGTDLISQTIEKAFYYVGIDFSLKQVLIFISLLFVLKALILILISYIRIKIFTDYEEKTRNKLFKNTIDASYPYLLNQKLGFLNSVLVTDVNYASSLLQNITGMALIFTSLFIYLFVAINLSLSITIVTCIFGILIFFIFKPLVYRTKTLSRQNERLNKKLAHYIDENIKGIKVVKSSQVRNKIVSRASQYFSTLKKLAIKIFLYSNISGSLMQPISVVFISLVFAISYKTANFNFAAILAIVYLIQRIFQYVQQLQTTFYKTSQSVPYVQNILKYEDEMYSNKEIVGGDASFVFRDRLEFNQVSFSYGGDRQILNDINFIVEKGEMVGLIGFSGSGKTTIVDLILRLFHPNDGSILLDGRNISDINIEQWRGHIGYVAQEPFLLNDTIANNIRFYDDSITEEDIIKAAKMADIYEFINNCEEKFNTPVGENGVLLSGGERQRLVIARVLARKPQILVLDEATSSLDNKSELKIQKVIENLKGQITVIAIAHRLSTVINSDKLLVLENGKIVENGKPDQLLKTKDSRFYKMYNIRK